MRGRKGVSALQEEFWGKMTESWRKATALGTLSLLSTSRDMGEAGGASPSLGLSERIFSSAQWDNSACPTVRRVVTCSSAPHGGLSTLWGSFGSVYPSTGKEQGREPWWPGTLRGDGQHPHRQAGAPGCGVTLSALTPAWTLGKSPLPLSTPATSRSDPLQSQCVVLDNTLCQLQLPIILGVEAQIFLRTSHSFIRPFVHSSILGSPCYEPSCQEEEDLIVSLRRT